MNRIDNAFNCTPMFCAKANGKQIRQYCDVAVTTIKHGNKKTVSTMTHNYSTNIRKETKKIYGNGILNRIESKEYIYPTNTCISGYMNLKPNGEIKDGFTAVRRLDNKRSFCGWLFDKLYRY